MVAQANTAASTTISATANFTEARSRTTATAGEGTRTVMVADRPVDVMNISFER
jgi:hypothetical protein